MISLRKDYLKLSILLEEDFFAVRYGAKGENSYYMPCGSPERIRQFLDILMQSRRFRLFYLRKQDCTLLEQLCPGMFRFRCDRDDSEYLYDIEKSADLSGGQYKYIRRKLRVIAAQFRIETEPLSDANISAALQIVSGWFHANVQGELVAQAERTLSERLFENMDALSARGFLLRLDGHPSAVAAGIPLSDAVFDFCVLKQNTGVRGLGTLMYYTMMDQLRGEYRFLNAEEDMGIPGLRLKKTEMHPCGMVDLWEAAYDKD